MTTMTITELLRVGEEQFDKAIKEMTMKNLMETISSLQKEMAKEQESFNSLSGELQNIKERNSHQYKQISKDLVTSQQRLSHLMTWSMKCFAQIKELKELQNVTQSKEPSPLKRTNSVKGPQPSVNTPSKFTNIQRSRSLLSVKQPDDETKGHPPPLSDDKPGSSSAVLHRPVIKNATILHINSQAEVNPVPDQMESRRKWVGTVGHSVGGSQDKRQTPDPGQKASTEKDSTGTDSVTAPTPRTGGGLYVKRSQPTRVITTTNISSTRMLPSYLQPEQSVTVSNTHPPTQKPNNTTATSSVVVISRNQALKSSAPAPASPTTATPTMHPLQISSVNHGVSKSQTIASDPPTSYKEFRALPSVRLLAKSFGSTTALNTAGTTTGSALSTGPRLSSSQSTLFHGSPLSRSQSSLSISDSPKKTSSSHIVLLSGNAPEQKPHTEQAPAIVNGKPPLPHTQTSRVRAVSRFSQPPVPASNGATELELARARLKTNRTSSEATLNSLNDGSAESGVVVSESSKNPESGISKAETQKYSTYLKKKDIAANKTNSTSSNVIEISNGVSRITNQVPTEHNVTSSTKYAAPIATRQSNSASSYLKMLSQSQAHDAQGKPGSYSTLPSRAPDPSSRVVSTATVTIRRAKSREELQDEGRQAASAKDSLLKQIQARRRDDGEVSNFLSMSTLSRSMPSLLHDGAGGQGDGSQSFPIKSSIVLPDNAYKSVPGYTEEDDVAIDDSSSRMNLRNWDPSPIISILYQIKMMDEVVEDISHQYITMEGLMEKLPINKKKATLLKTWKRRFFKAQDGWLHYYESGNKTEASESIQLMGGEIHDIGNRILGVDDGRGRYLMVRCPTEKEYGQWKLALESQTADNTKATYVKPVLKSSRNPSKHVVLIDLGSSAIRAGVLGTQASLPDIFFPSLLAVDRKTGQVIAVGTEALKPDVRSKCKMVHPIRPSNKVDQFNIELQYMGSVFKYVFNQLNIQPADYWVMLSTPQNLADPLKKGLMEQLVDKLNVKGVCMVQQSLLSLYSYKATSGIILDMGHRIEVLPIFEGFVIEGGVSRCPFGGQKVQESLTISLLENNYKFTSVTEQWLVRYIMEQSCYVAIDFGQELEWCKTKPDTLNTSVNLAKFHLPDGAYLNVQHDFSRFKSPEGFFNVDMWELDYPTIHKLIHQAIQSCPMDNRRHMWRAVYLSGGVTMLPGFPERLEKELTKLAPPGVPVEVHAAPQRYHSAYIGAGAVALMPQFEQMAVSREEWKRENVRSFKKWQAPTS